MPVHETDICIIGGGITSAMLAERLSELRPGVGIVVVEAGRSISRRAEPRPLSRPRDPVRRASLARRLPRGSNRRRHHLDDDGGGRPRAPLGGACNRFSEEDLRLKSMYGLATDWPIEWRELERYYGDAERRLNVSGEPSPLPATGAQPRIRRVDSAVLQPADPQGLGGAERPQLLRVADGKGISRRSARDGCCVCDTCW